jgi:translocation and assembly module TamB
MACRQLQAKVNITSLDQLSDNLAGKVSGGATLSQPTGQAFHRRFILILVGDRIALPGFILRQGSRARQRVVNLANSPSQLIVSLKGLSCRSSLVVNATFNGTEQTRRQSQCR